MNIPNLPTDNLYKFIALAGVIITILPWFFLYNNIQKLSVQVSDIEMETGILNIELEYLTQKADHLDGAVEKNGNQFKKEELISALSNVEKMKEDSKEINIKSEKIKYKINLAKTLIDQIKFLKHLTYIFTLFGILLSFFGFYFWYYKVQVYQDKFLKNEKTISKQGK